MQLSRLGGQPTFTELLTCLELARDVRVLHSESPPEMTTPASESAWTRRAGASLCAAISCGGALSCAARQRRARCE